MSIIITKILIIFCTLLIHLLNDFVKITKGLPIKHGISGVTRLIIFTLVSFMSYKKPEDFLFWFINISLTYWLLFDFILNYIREKPLNYLGNKAMSDITLRKLKINNIHLFKITLIVIVNILFVLI